VGAVLRRSLIAIGAGVVVAAAFAAPAAAVPTPAPSDHPKPVIPSHLPGGPVPGGFASWAELYAMQDRLNAAATRILQTGGAGNASIVAAPQNRELRVYWNGAVPASVRSLAANLGVPVSIQPAAFSHRELVAAAQKLASTDSRVAEVAPKADGSGLDVTVTSTAHAAGTVDALATSAIPLTIKTGQKPQSLFSRQADTPPFWGGSRYNTPVGGCSNGFGLSVSGSANVFEISAGHCGSNGQAANIPGQPTPTGTIQSKSTCRDTLLINYPSGVAGRIYTGAYNSSSSTNVIGATSDFVGNLIETGGASSGEHFNIPVQAVDVFAAIGGIPCTTVGPLTRAGYSTATCAVAPGDSGGPAYSYSGSSVFGRGTITAGNLGSAVCPGVVSNGGNTVWYAPLVRPAGDPQIGSLQFYGVGILTG
jgi:hypothetical protein